MKVKIGFFSIILFLSLFISNSFFAIASLCAVIIHELGHIVAAKLCGIRLNEFNIGIYGAGLMPYVTDYSYGKEIILCVCGPAANFLSSIVLLPLFRITHNFTLLYFIMSSIALAALNLLPIKDFDGGRILYSILCLIKEPLLAERIILATSFVLIFVLWLLSVYMLLTVTANLSLFIFSVSLFVKIFINK